MRAPSMKAGDFQLNNMSGFAVRREQRRQKRYCNGIRVTYLSSTMITGEDAFAGDLRISLNNR